MKIILLANTQLLKETLIFLSVVLYSSLSYGMNTKDIEFLRDKFLSAKLDSSKINLSIQLIEAFAPVNLDSSIYYHNRVVDIATRGNKFIKELCHSYFSIGGVLLNKGKYETAKKHFEKGIRIARTHDDIESISFGLMSLGVLHWELSNLVKAIELTYEAIDLAKVLEDQYLEAVATNNLGLIHQDMEYFDEADAYKKSALKLFRATKDTAGIALTLNNLGHGWTRRGKYVEALEVLEEAVPLAKISGKQNILELAIANKGYALVNLGEIIKGFQLIEEAIQMAENSKNTRHQVALLDIISSLYYDKEYYKIAIRAAKKGEKISTETKFKKRLPRLYSTIANSLKHLGNFEEALIWLEKHNKIKEELSEIQRKKEVLNLEIQYQLIQKETENHLLELKNRNQRSLITTIIIAFLAIFFFGYYYSKQQQQWQLDEVKKSIAADLHDDVGSNLNSITRLAKGLKKVANSERENENIDLLVNKSNEAIKNIVDVIWTLDNEETQMKYLIEKMENHLDTTKRNNPSILIDFSLINIKKEKPLKIKTRHHLFMIFKEAINNIQKHTEPQSIHIELLSFNKKFVMNILNIFSKKKESLNSTNKGILNINNRVKELNGEVLITKESKYLFSPNKIAQNLRLPQNIHTTNKQQ